MPRWETHWVLGVGMGECEQSRGGKGRKRKVVPGVPLKHTTSVRYSHLGM